MKWFGPKSWGAPICQDVPRIEIPVDEVCCYCHHVIRAGDSGFEMPMLGEPGDPVTVAVHKDCFLRAVLPWKGPPDPTRTRSPRRRG